MDENDILLTFAEVSVAFAGFASLASLIGRRGDVDMAAVISMRLLNMLATSLSVTALALIPSIFIFLEWQSDNIWRVSSLVGLIIWSCAGFYIVKLTRQSKREKGFSKAASLLNNSLSWGASIALILCSAGLPAVNPFASYLAALIAILGVSGILFFKVISALVSVPETIE